MSERRRVLLAPALWGLLTLLLGLNILLVISKDIYTRSFYRCYQSVLPEYQGLSTERALTRLDEELSDLQTTMRLHIYQATEDATVREFMRQELVETLGEDFETRINSGAFDLSAQARLAVSDRINALHVLQTQVEHLRDYPAFLAQVQANVRQMRAFSVFNQAGSFSSRNIEKTGADFPTAVELQLDNDFALSALVSDPVGAYSLLIFTLALTLQFLSERKKGLWSLIHGSKNGRARLAMKRSGILLLGVLIGTLVLLGGKLLFVAIRCGGLGSLSRNVQSLSVFSDFPWVMPVWAFLLFYFLLKVFGMWLVGLTCWAILQSVNHLPLAICAAGVVLTGEYAMFTLIPDSFVCVIFRYVNLFALVDVPKLAMHYLNLNLFGWPVQGFLLSVCLIPPVLGLLLAANLLLASQKKPVSRINSILILLDRLRVPFSKAVGRLRLFGLELYKLLWLQKGLLILLLTALYSFVILTPQPLDQNLYDPELAKFSAAMQGPITEQTLAEINAQITKYASWTPTEGVLRQLTILQNLRDTCEHSLAAKDGMWLINPEPYTALIGAPTDYTNYQRENAMVLLLALILLLSGIFSLEHQSGMTQLLQRSFRGGVILWRKKLAASLLLTLLVWLLFEAGELWQISRTYGSFALSAPLQSFQFLADYPYQVELWAALAAYLLLRLLAMLAAVSMVLLISCLCRHTNLSILAACALLILPAGLRYMGIDALNALCLSRLLSPLEATKGEYLAAAGLVCACILLSRQCWLGKKHEKSIRQKDRSLPHTTVPQVKADAESSPL